MLRTRFTELFGLAYPVMSAPMAMHSGGTLAAAVSGAGGLSFADPRPWLGRAKDTGATVMCQVQNYRDAETAVAAGADVLVAQGTEAGGHTGTVGLLPFLAGMGPSPVLAWRVVCSRSAVMAAVVPT